jgi:alkylhydroperoxidase/carboxymuconolactone decarboxylase family protein YurZ
MPENPLDVYKRIDPAFLEFVDNNREFALSDGALPRKFKLLVAMALDASKGTVDGTRSLAQAAVKAGAIKEEIAETLRVAQFIGGVGSVYTAGRALTDTF